ncbi:hypothetical protein H2O64_13820 [Kordia sp. YSTF-M3]|uniref:DUF4595 domain-containing protein n=1 Tax=Kordia aestuariivivens TaxID=2759037 RepID=A0ABR7QBP1_9FLAO|nr:hypothetical protein [Kordia aestuariivivens]MBC8755749.1 hypothetical protein [Kordia aestuariivivens]
MKSLYFLFLCCFISCTTATKPLDPCYMDAGIKKAKIQIKTEANEIDKDDFMTIEYTQQGNPLKVFKSKWKSTTDYVYVEDILKYIVTSGPDYFYEGQPEEEIIIKVDTLFITKNDAKGRMLESIGTDKVNYKYSYANCNEGSVITYAAEEKQSTMHFLKENGNIMKKTVTFYIPFESTTVSKYSEYKFDEFGHWIERSLEAEDGEMYTEMRALEYY